ncbi:MAG: hypothetical protein IT457_24025 [Planctomycetes bacterium]|nr:hypothetical protein [Planctomycetota bacterium]
MAKKKDDDMEASLPQRVTYRPAQVTAGAMMEVAYSTWGAKLPAIVTIAWEPTRGVHTLRFTEKEVSGGAATIAIEVPHGATAGHVHDSPRQSKRLLIPVEHKSVRRQPGFLGRLFG